MPNRLPRSRTLKGEPKLVYYEKGDGRPGETPLVLAHGATFRSEDWENIHPRLATRYRVIAYDMRGHGRSGRAGAYGVEALADDLLRIVRDVAGAPSIVLAHSVSAAATIVAAAREPARIRGLVLEDPLLARYGTSWNKPYYEQLRKALDQSSDPAALRAAVAKLPLPVVGPRGERTIGEVRGFYSPERLATYFAGVDPAFVDHLLALEQDQAGIAAIRAATASVGVPALLLAADPKQGSTLDEGEPERLVAKGWQLVRFPGVGHRIHGLRPEAFLEPLEPFLRANRTL
ncbi:MAG: alpha/beta hydrolase [Deltaproteobacteria bacterium]|nr:alpha/beta hydrolase [Deltaproteobacteria bacterium]